MQASGKLLVLGLEASLGSLPYLKLECQISLPPAGLALLGGNLPPTSFPFPFDQTLFQLENGPTKLTHSPTCWPSHLGTLTNQQSYVYGLVKSRPKYCAGPWPGSPTSLTAEELRGWRQKNDGCPLSLKATWCSPRPPVGTPEAVVPRALQTQPPCHTVLSRKPASVTPGCSSSAVALMAPRFSLGAL